MISSLNILDTVEICTTDKLLNKHYFKTKIQDIDLDNTFFTMVPSSSTGRPVLFFKGQEYELFAKGSEGILSWKIHFLGSDKVDNFPSCKFQAISGPHITQRREYYRQPVSVNAMFFILEENNSDFNSLVLEHGHESRIVDLSGGGCAFMTSESLPLDAKLFIRFQFRENSFAFKGEVLDKIDFTNSRAEWDYKYRLKWYDTKDREIDKLIKFVFDQQREMLVSNLAKGRSRSG